MVGVMKNKRPIVHSIKDDKDKYRLKFDLVDGRFVFFSLQILLFVCINTSHLIPINY